MQVLPHEIAPVNEMQRVEDLLHEMGDWMDDDGDAVDNPQAQDKPRDPPTATVHI